MFCLIDQCPLVIFCVLFHFYHFLFGFNFFYLPSQLHDSIKRWRNSKLPKKLTMTLFILWMSMEKTDPRNMNNIMDKKFNKQSVHYYLLTFHSCSNLSSLEQNRAMLYYIRVYDLYSIFKGLIFYWLMISQFPQYLLW